MAFRSAETKFLFVATLLVILGGVKTVTSILEPPSLTGLTYRAPASVPSSVSVLHAPTVPTAASAFLDFNCLKLSQKELVVKGPYLQIRGKACSHQARNGDIKIVNKSNGYTASVFNSGREEFQTDLIQLVEGANEIEIQYESNNGKKFDHQLVVKASH